MPTVCLAVSGHGFGHSVRCAEVANALLARGARVVVRTDAPEWLFPERVQRVPSPGWPLDVGVAQHDGLELNIDETRRRWQAFAAHFDDRATAEAKLLLDNNVDVVLADIPPLALTAAARATVGSYALANFTWDWIYGAWSGFEEVIQCVRRGYASADRLLRLPLHSQCADAFSAFRSIEDVPLIARRARRRRRDVRHDLGIGNEARVVLLSFGGFNAAINVAALGEWQRYVFVATPPVALDVRNAPANVRALNESPRDYVSLLAACDVVVTKPGYGIVADCLANRVAVLFTDRGPFREYDVLAEALQTLGRARYVPRAELLAGHLGPHLDALLDSPVTWTEQRMDGADFVADRVLRGFTIEQNLGK
jgi:UDP:flavonoid glycosyltransferase YjiC (YdhE family)